MKLDHLSLTHLKIPFRIQFKHNTADRSITQTVFIIAQSNKYRGYGEGCPREYVTNESMETVTSFFEEIKSEVLLFVHDVDSLMEFRKNHLDRIHNNHASWCAIEMALLDLLAKEKSISIERILGLNELTGPFSYTAVIGGGSLDYFKNVAQKHFQMGFEEFKIKISGNPDEDYSKLKFLNELNPNNRMRLDANNLWINSGDVAYYCKKLPVNITGLEEPLKSKSISALADLHKAIGIPIILDESFQQLSDLEEIIKTPEAFILNLRVSKMGGILNSLEIVKRIRERKIPTIVGAQVGESSLLTRAALLIAEQLKEYCIGMEGAYGTLLLEDDIVTNSLMFGEEGKLLPYFILDKTEFGLQLNVLEEKIKMFS